MGTQYYCKNRSRRSLVLAGKGGPRALNGIDYLDVSPDQKTLVVYLLRPLPKGKRGRYVRESLLRSDNIDISGGAPVEWRLVSASDNVLTIAVEGQSGFSTYRLSIVRSELDARPPEGFDQQLSSVEFSFKVNCPGDFDCKPVTVCPPGRANDPEIDYLARDYASFRRLMLDRLSVSVPDWKERSPADMAVMLVELMAYAADRVSYYQDAVATEAYIGTARMRTSLRRHARLLDYRVHEGCNARAWVCFEVRETISLAKTCEATGEPTRLLTSCRESPLVSPEDYLELIAGQQPEVFELLHDVTLYTAHNRILFYTWADEQCCLPAGATRATLLCDRNDPLLLRKGDVLVFEELKGPATGEEADADPSHRHAVRLTNVYPEARAGACGAGQRIPGEPYYDLLTGEQIVEIEWHPEDRLPFPLCLSSRISDTVHTAMSCARGNVALADHGRTVPQEQLAAPAEGQQYRPHLACTGLTFCVPYEHQKAVNGPASLAVAYSPQDAVPAISLAGDGYRWSAVRDLLGSDRFAPDFVVEIDDDRTPYLRFGDFVLGRRPSPGFPLEAQYRVGNGNAGNVGAGAIRNLVAPGSLLPEYGAILRLWNPLPARGGADAEREEEARLYAPQAFWTMERAVTASDYAELARRHPEVQKAVASFRWTGSWYTVFLIIDRIGGRRIDEGFVDEIRGFMERYRMAGYDLEVRPPVYVPLNIELYVCVAPGYYPAAVKKALLDMFSNADLPDGRRGFFHPDNLTFGQPVYLSQILAAAMQVPGVAWVEPVLFHRQGMPPGREIDDGYIGSGLQEIIRLDNDPGAPDNGRISFVMGGGQ